MRGLFARLRTQFTLVVVDGPPIAAGRHAAAFSATTDYVVLVVEVERIRAADLARARATLEQNSARRYWAPC
jgi:Mrp family chromosome partitioning ATPase